MAKVRTAWFCVECGHKEFKWQGQCTSCKEWNTLQEEVVQAVAARYEATSSRPLKMSEVDLSKAPRLTTTFTEFDRLIGGGVVPGSLILIGGEPGIGKSTLLLQLAHQFGRVLYVCGEESAEQTVSRAKRLGIKSEEILFLNETDVGLIKQQIDQVKPQAVIVDSIQVVYKPELTSSPGSITQVRETATEFMHLSKRRGITTFLVGHVTKSGEIAGPRVLEHLVDTVLYFEGDRQQHFRLLRAVKNRFGPTDEIAVFQMGQEGLIEVHNPSELFLEERQKRVPGSVIVPTLEGTRPFLVETQALVTPTAFSTPSRRATGIHPNRLALLLAVLEKRLRYRLHTFDVFVSIAGGLQIRETSIDLGILLAVASSHRNVIIPPETIVIGEVGLGGEIRGVNRIEARIKEAERMGFTRAIIPRRNAKGITTTLTLTPVDFVDEAIRTLIPSRSRD